MTESADVATDAASVELIVDGQLPMSARQEQFSLAFVSLVVAAAGCSIKTHQTDYDGVDITIVSSAEYETYYCPEFELQLKCTTQHDLLKGGHFSWPMEAKPFNKLTNPKRYTPAVLGVLLIPHNGPWLQLDEDRLLSESRMYWQYAIDLGTMPEGQASRTVHLPRSNLFDVNAVQGILQRIGEGGDM